MARSKFGGAHSKIRGKLAGIIYQVKRNSDGKIIQQAYKAPEDVQYSNTEKQAISRMTIAQVERMWAVLPAIIKDAYSAIPIGTLSFQHFSKLNYPLLVQDRTNHWSSGNTFDWRDKYDVTAPAGPWILTDGILPPAIFYSIKATRGVNNSIELSLGMWQYSDTVGQVLSSIGVLPGDYIYFCFFIKYGDNTTPAVVPYRCLVNPRYDYSRPIDDAADTDVFLHSGEWEINLSQHLITREVAIDISGENTQPEYIISCIAVLIARNTDSGTLFSSSQFWLTGVNNMESYYFRSPQQAYISYKSNDTR